MPSLLRCVKRRSTRGVPTTLEPSCSSGRRHEGAVTSLARGSQAGDSSPRQPSDGTVREGGEPFIMAAEQGCTDPLRAAGHGFLSGADWSVPALLPVDGCTRFSDGNRSGIVYQDVATNSVWSAHAVGSCAALRPRVRSRVGCGIAPFLPLSSGHLRAISGRRFGTYVENPSWWPSRLYRYDSAEPRRTIERATAGSFSVPASGKHCAFPSDGSRRHAAGRNCTCVAACARVWCHRRRPGLT